MAKEQKLLGSLALGLDPILDENRKGCFPNTSRYAWNRMEGAKKFPANGKQNNENENLHKPFRNLFFFRNRPHAQQVRHIKGLLDVPICTVLGSRSQTLAKVRSSSTSGTEQFLANGKTNDENSNLHNSFPRLFSLRNRPHTQKVRHIRGLLGAPICTVFGKNSQIYDKMRSSNNLGTFERGVARKFSRL